ncbi:deoxyribodipyrimidine photo-lyase [Photobacterium lipolyticum]|uniref:Deoxyribodipyrimidine photo-lyase n=1 Tax=Photobacterium lipolyticum TaxID=266810 RepID=A0A2T3N328_9GAMM|nr:deoxyribodipyrimidine photo-lyase [Photobacterium lipolyticum]PSW06783.1 deoxyribodipyrimidine photo-lyase [Photobacterium lipolyticum]
MNNKGTSLLWFRADLRTVDNTALRHACLSGRPVIALYVATPMQWHQHDVAPIQVDFIQRRLLVLQQQLRELNIPLLIFEVGDYRSIPELITKLVQQYQISHVFCNKQDEWNEQQRDHDVGLALANMQVEFSIVDDSCAIAPGRVKTKQGEPFKVFTPFRREWLNVYHSLLPEAQPAPQAVVVHPVTASLLDQDDRSTPFTYPKKDSVLWPVEEDAIRQRLEAFCSEKVQLYHQHRDFPAIDGTSCLSPYLAIGALSARQCISMLRSSFPLCLEPSDQGAFCWLNELIWREFYRHLTEAYGKLSRNQPFHAWTSKIRWRDADEDLKCWQQGQTGFPIVDAAMRQLLATGWMHNRLRMIVASFLTKDLLIDWRAGEQWFMSHLIDGDFASNNGGWQWAASTGTDAQPYFRVFNPTLQGQRFDPTGDFIRIWIKELKDVPNKYIHTPHLWDGANTLDYPRPIVDHKLARLLAIESFKQAKALAQENI